MNQIMKKCLLHVIFAHFQIHLKLLSHFDKKNYPKVGNFAQLQKLITFDFSCSVPFSIKRVNFCQNKIILLQPNGQKPCLSRQNVFRIRNRGKRGFFRLIASALIIQRWSQSYLEYLLRKEQMFPQQPNNNYRTTFDGENISEKPCFSTKLLNVTLYFCQERVAIHFIIIIIIFIIIGLAQLLFLPLSVFEEINGRRKEKLLQKL